MPDRPATGPLMFSRDDRTGTGAASIGRAIVEENIAPSMPDDACDLTITEGNKALFPITATVQSGPIPERTLDALADDAQVTLETGGGRIVLAMPDPVEVRDDAVVTFGDVATVRRTFERPTGFARIDGQPAREVRKWPGTSIETVAAVTSAVAELRRD